MTVPSSSDQNSGVVQVSAVSSHWPQKKIALSIDFTGRDRKAQKADRLTRVRNGSRGSTAVIKRNIHPLLLYGSDSSPAFVFGAGVREHFSVTWKTQRAYSFDSLCPTSAVMNLFMLIPA